MNHYQLTRKKIIIYIVPTQYFALQVTGIFMTAPDMSYTYMRTGAVSPSRQFGSWITTLIACSKSILFKDHPFLPYTDAALSAYSPPVRQTSPRDGRVAVLCKPNLTSGPGCPRRHVYCTRVTDKHLRRCQVYCPCGAGNPAN